MMDLYARFCNSHTKRRIYRKFAESNNIFVDCHDLTSSNLAMTGFLRFFASHFVLRSE
ncbi:hypothetical protein [Helicobacter sp. 23-1045]